MKYTITITKEEYDFILAAVNAYTSSLRQKMADQAQVSVIRQDKLEVFAAPSKSAVKDTSSPWGYKKDGTPKKRPGRAVKEAKK